MIVLVICLFSTGVNAQGCYLFIGSYNWDKAKSGLYVYRMDTATGGLQMVSKMNDVLNPAYLTLSADGSHLYACTEAQTPGAGSVAGYNFDEQHGTLSFINKQTSGGENPVYLTMHSSRRWLVNANYSSGSVAVYPVNADGSIAPAKQVVYSKDSSINTERQRSAHIHAAVFSPDQRYIFFPDLGADKIRCYAFDTSVNEPLQGVERPYTKTVAGSGPRHFVFHPNGMFCYCIEELCGNITAYKYADGVLDSIQRIAAHNGKVKRGFSSADIHISPDGLFLYASNRGKENNIAIYAIGQSDGTLKSLGYQSTLGDHPRNFVIDPSGKFLLVANQITGDVVVFKRNIKTGMLTKTGVKVKVPGASCLQIKNYN